MKKSNIQMTTLSELAKEVSFYSMIDAHIAWVGIANRLGIDVDKSTNL